MFALEGVQLGITEDALHEIATQALRKTSGARGLRSILEDLLLDVMYELPDQKDLERVVIDMSAVKKESTPKLIYKMKESA